MNRIIKSLILLSACFSLGYVNRIPSRWALIADIITWTANNATLSALDTDLMFYYACEDNADNTTVDDSTDSSDGTASTNTSNLSITGKYNDGFQFDGSSEYVNTNFSLQTAIQNEAVTIAGWFKPDDGQPGSLEYMWGDVYAPSATTDQLSLRLETNGKVTVAFRSDSGTNIAATSTDAVFPDGATSWTHIAVTLDSSSLKLYVNGSEVGSDDVSGEDLTAYGSTQELFFGARNVNGSAASHFDGDIDELVGWDTTLSPTEVTALYNDGTGAFYEGN